MYCQQCGAYNRDDAKFCINCGHPLKEKETPPPTQVLGKDTFSLVKNALKGKYEVISELGRGGMAIVFKARDLKLDRLVAIKVLPPEFAYDIEFLRRFHHEAKIAAKLDHPNIISIYEVGEADGLTYFAMSYIDGETLADYIKRTGPIPTSEAIRITKDIASALSYAHKRGIIHRDIKPENILLDQEGRIKVTDFGIAKAAYGTTLATRTGVSLGTPHYMSPEQARGKPIDKRSDLYSLGIVMYEMVTGRVPFEGVDITSIMYQHVHETPDPPRKMNKDLPEWLERIILHLLAKDPDARFQTADDLITALTSEGKITHPVRKERAELTKTVTAEIIPQIPTEPLRKHSSKKRLILISLGLIIAGSLAYLAASGKFPLLQKTRGKSSQLAAKKEGSLAKPKGTTKGENEGKPMASLTTKEKGETHLPSSSFKKEIKEEIAPPRKENKRPNITPAPKGKRKPPLPYNKPSAKREGVKPVSPLERPLQTREKGDLEVRRAFELLSPKERAMLRRLPLQERAFYLAKKVDTPKAWQEFLKRFPLSPRAPYARRRLRELTSGQGWVRITAVPYALVTIDGKEIGRVPPPRDINLTPGTHRIRLTMEDYQPYEEILTIKPGDRKRVHHEFPLFGTLVINSFPQGAEVILDGERVGKTPLRLMKVPIGEHTVKVLLPGYVIETKRVTITKFETTFLSLTLQKE
ncbi:MAG: protein kinase [Acidobacteria bacterium]|nr:protein kinase [Acidobacteriota bacterium]